MVKKAVVSLVRALNRIMAWPNEPKLLKKPEQLNRGVTMFVKGSAVTMLVLTYPYVNGDQTYVSVYFLSGLKQGLRGKTAILDVKDLVKCGACYVFKKREPEKEMHKRAFNLANSLGHVPVSRAL